MTRKPKPPKAPRVRVSWRDRARDSMLERPLRWWIGVITAGGLAALPVIQWVAPWIAGHEAKYQRAAAHKADIDAVVKSADSHAKEDKLERLRGVVRDARAMEFITRRAMIDCAGKTERRTIARTEAEACKDFEIDHQQAMTRLQQARQALEAMRQ